MFQLICYSFSTLFFLILLETLLLWTPALNHLATYFN
uniref:Uncharacterized protein n=1 Tax=Siphoviridae sp. ctLqe90 TaxID=2825456 RepID=A0A8S5Q2E9_9CAUD|nr:MAG TPA: hypothetical protein [Siphoviridae sp. ctLqe90]